MCAVYATQATHWMRKCSLASPVTACCVDLKYYSIRIAAGNKSTNRRGPTGAVLWERYTRSVYLEPSSIFASPFSSLPMPGISSVPPLRTNACHSNSASQVILEPCQTNESERFVRNDRLDSQIQTGRLYVDILVQWLLCDCCSNNSSTPPLNRDTVRAPC